MGDCNCDCGSCPTCDCSFDCSSFDDLTFCQKDCNFWRGDWGLASIVSKGLESTTGLSCPSCSFLLCDCNPLDAGLAWWACFPEHGDCGCGDMACRCRRLRRCVHYTCGTVADFIYWILLVVCLPLAFVVSLWRFVLRSASFHRDIDKVEAQMSEMERQSENEKWTQSFAGANPTGLSSNAGGAEDAMDVIPDMYDLARQIDALTEWVQCRRRISAVPSPTLESSQPSSMPATARSFRPFTRCFFHNLEVPAWALEQTSVEECPLPIGVSWGPLGCNCALFNLPRQWDMQHFVGHFDASGLGPVLRHQTHFVHVNPGVAIIAFHSLATVDIVRQRLKRRAGLFHMLKFEVSVLSSRRKAKKRLQQELQVLRHQHKQCPDSTVAAKIDKVKLQLLDLKSGARDQHDVARLQRDAARLESHRARVKAHNGPSDLEADIQALQQKLARSKSDTDLIRKSVVSEVFSGQISTLFKQGSAERLQMLDERAARMASLWARVAEASFVTNREVSVVQREAAVTALERLAQIHVDNDGHVESALRAARAACDHTGLSNVPANLSTSTELMPPGQVQDMVSCFSSVVPAAPQS